MLFRERSLRVKNRMREIRSSGSVRGGAGNIPAYSARGQLDAVGAQSFEAGITVDLNHAFEPRQVNSRTLGPTIGAVEVNNRRRIRSTPGSVIAGVDPKPTSLGAAAAGIEHRDRRIVGEQLV
jgi:hypothetical protein